MATSRLAQHLPSLFGPSRRAAWRLSTVRRVGAAGALLLAIHMALGAVTPSAPAASSPAGGDPAGPTLALPLTTPATHLSPGDEVRVYVPGRERPVATAAHLVGTGGGGNGRPTARITVRADDVGPLVQEMGDRSSTGGGFVLVRE